MKPAPHPLETTDLSYFWMPFTANRQYKAAPRLLVSAQGMYYRDADGHDVLDGTAGLWCVNAGHSRKEIVDAITVQASTLDFAPTFQMGHPMAFRAAEKVAEIMPEGLNRIFFVNSGSEAVDTALKIALAYHRARGEGQRTRFIGRERGYHGVGFGGISVGGISPNRKAFSANLMPGVDHLPHTHAPSTTRSPRASRPGARIWPMSWSASSRCTTRRPSRPSSSNRWPARPVCWCRPRATWSACARCATSTASC